MPKCLNEFPWRSISGCGNMASALFDVGDYVNGQFKNGVSFQARILDFEHDVLQNGGTAPISWELVELFPDRYSWNRNDTNEGSWEKTRIRSNLNDEGGSIYSLIPDEIKEVVLPVVKLTADTHNGENNIIKTVDKFWIRSEKETYGRCIFSAPGEGKWYEYFRQEDTPWHMTRNGSREYYMLRSPCAGSGHYFCDVNDAGIPGYNSASDGCGVAFGFCT